MGLLGYFFIATLYLSPFFLLERLISPPVQPRIIPYCWPRLISLLLLQSVLLYFAAEFPFHTEVLFSWNLPYVVALREFWSSVSPVFAWICAFLIFTFLHYWTHVARHRLPMLWRWCHQMHHSSERFETYMSFYIHPFELVLLQILFAVALFFSGFDLKMLSALGLVYIFINAWAHMNVKSPQWLGYVIFRPEQHSRHHAGFECNFGVIPLWDLLFGTFQNPKNHPERVGFESDNGKSFWDYLLGRL